MNNFLPGLIFFVYLIIAGTTAAVSQDLQKYYTAATAAYESKDYKTFYENIVEANKLHPYHQIILYRLGIASAHMKKQEEAFSALEKAIHIDATLDLNAEDFATIRNTTEFKSLLNLQQKLQKKEISSDTAFTISDRSSHIESIATDDRNGEFYFSSIHKRKIIKRNRNGELTDFVEPGQFGLTAVFDLQVDQKNNILWACASPIPEMEGYDTMQQSALFKFNTTTGALLGKYEADKSISSVFGDLTLNSQGEVFVSDGKTNTIFIVDDETKALQPYFTSEEFWNIQGIAFSTDDRYLFIADYIKGPYRLDTSNKELVKLYAAVDLSLKGIDGLLYFNNSLIAIQNGVTPNRVTQYFLSPNHDKIIRGSIIDKAHLAFNEPTMGCISNNRLYYVANSSWGAYDKNHLLQTDQINDLVILTTLLK